MDIPDLHHLATQAANANNIPDPIRRYHALRDLAPQLKAALAIAQDEAIADARQTLPEPEVAEQAGVGVHEIRRRVTAHRHRTGTLSTRGRKPAEQ